MLGGSGGMLPRKNDKKNGVCLIVIIELFCCYLVISNPKMELNTSVK